MSEYNGWTNKETRTYRPSSPEEIEEYVGQVLLEGKYHDGLTLDFLRMCLQDTNWRELYEHIEEDMR